MPANTEDLIERTGGCGLFQILHTLTTYVCRVLDVWGIYIMVFGNMNPGWTCEESKHASLSENSSWENYVTNTTNFNSSMDCSSLSQCSAVHFATNGKTPVSEWSLICDQTWILSLISSVQMIGQIVGSTVAGYVSENMGRRVGMYGSLFLYAVTVLIAAFSNSWQMYVGTMFFVGASGGGINPISIVYTMEFLTPKWRGIVGGLPITSTGLLVFSVIIYLERDWRMVHITIAVISFAMLFTRLWVSESMRWLAVHGKIDDAKSVVRRMAKYNRTSVPEMDAIEQVANLELSKSKSRKYTYTDLFSSRKSCILNVKLMIVWIAEGAVFATLTLSLSTLPGDFYINFIITIACEIPLIALNGLILNKLGRIKAGVCYFGLGFLSLVTALVISLSEQFPKQHLIFALLPMVTIMFFAAGKMTLHLFTTELLPTNIRALGFSFHLTASQVGATVAPFFIQGRYFSYNTFLAFQSALNLITILIFLSLSETNNKPMDDLEVNEPNGDENCNEESLTLDENGTCSGVSKTSHRDESKRILPTQIISYMKG